MSVTKPLTVIESAAGGGGAGGVGSSTIGAGSDPELPQAPSAGKIFIGHCCCSLIVAIGHFVGS